MANELQFDYDAGLTDLYVRVWKGDQYVVAATGALETYTAGNYANYTIVATEVGAPGIYSADIPANTPPGTYLYQACRQAGAAPATTDQAVTGIGEAYWTTSGGGAGDPSYAADVNFTLDQANVRDEYTTAWFRDASLVSSVGTPMIHVARRSTGLTLIASSYMTQVGTTGRYKYDAVTTERSNRGDALCITVFGTIDGSLRTWPVTRSRDS
jgi:hypothetical protein